MLNFEINVENSKSDLTDNSTVKCDNFFGRNFLIIVMNVCKLYSTVLCVIKITIIVKQSSKISLSKPLSKMALSDKLIVITKKDDEKIK
jgi:hypothetical protein